MPISVILSLDGLELKGEMNDTPAALALAKALPLELGLSRWGEEYYGDVGLALGPFEGPQTDVLEVGELAFWQPGNALCLFFGPTPMSQGDECRAASPVFVLGRVEGDWQAVSALGPEVSAVLSAG